jgi:hypothetical protein
MPGRFEFMAVDPNCRIANQATASRVRSFGREGGPPQAKKLGSLRFIAGGFPQDLL